MMPLMTRIALAWYISTSLFTSYIIMGQKKTKTPQVGEEGRADLDKDGEGDDCVLRQAAELFEEQVHHATERRLFNNNI